MQEAPQHHRVERTVAVPATELTALLAVRPTRWLQPFLRLAARTPPAQRPTYRLRADDAAPDGSSTFSFGWTPAGAADVFIRFRGQLVVAAAGPRGCVLRLEGFTRGGRPGRNQRVLTTLADLLAESVESDRAASTGVDDPLPDGD